MGVTVEENVIISFRYITLRWKCFLEGKGRTKQEMFFFLLVFLGQRHCTKKWFTWAWLLLKIKIITLKRKKKKKETNAKLE